MILLFVNEFVIKEIRRTLKEFNFSHERINYAIEYVLECCIVRKNVPKARFSKYVIKDKNDIPILAGAVQESAVLVTEDNALKNDAKTYLECVNPSDPCHPCSIYTDFGKHANLRDFLIFPEIRNCCIVFLPQSRL